MDFARFDKRRYPVVGVAEGYDEWSATYDDAVCDAMDLRLLERVRTVSWADVEHAADLACGTGRTGRWLRGRGVRGLDGLDLSPRMLARARTLGVYEDLEHGDLRATPFADAAYDLVVVCLADEHLPALPPLYLETARLLHAGGSFVIVGYHPQFLMTVGMPTHFHRDDGQAVAIETHVHLLGDHVEAAHRAGFRLLELHEGLVDAAYLQQKPKWAAYLGTPVSFCIVWRLGSHQTDVRAGSSRRSSTGR